MDSDERVKSRLSQVLTRGACPDSNLKSTVQPSQFFFPLTIGLGQDMQCLLFFFPLEVRAGRRQAMSVSFTLDPWAGPSQIIWKPVNIILTLHISTAFASLFISFYGLMKVHDT